MNWWQTVSTHDEEVKVRGTCLPSGSRGSAAACCTQLGGHTQINTNLLVFLQHGLLFQKFLHQDLRLPLPLLVVFLRLLGQNTQV